jgi:hypothetical protein
LFTSRPSIRKSIRLSRSRSSDLNFDRYQSLATRPVAIAIPSTLHTTQRPTCRLLAKTMLTSTLYST